MCSDIFLFLTKAKTVSQTNGSRKSLNSLKINPVSYTNQFSFTAVIVNDHKSKA